MKLGDQLEAGFREAAEKYNIPHTVNRAGSMIGFFFTNEKVSDYDKAKTSDFELFADYYRLMAEEGISFHHPNLKECSFQLHIRKSILQKQLKHSITCLQSLLNNSIKNIAFPDF